MSKTQYLPFRNKREMNRFVSFATKFYSHAITYQQAVEAFTNDNATDLLDTLTGLAKDPSIGFPKDKTGWANTRRAYRTHWQKIEIDVQSCLNEHEKRTYLRKA